MVKINAYKNCQLLISMGLLAANMSNAEVTIFKHDDTASGLKGWLMKTDAVEIQLNPLTQDQAKGFYLGRGFSEQVAQQISKKCVYQAVFKNISNAENKTSISVDLSNWGRVDAGVEKALISKQTWLDKWASMGASDSSLLAFRWATFPSEQDFSISGDYGWGMILFDQPDGQTFDVLTTWQQNNIAKQQLIKGLNCPK